MALSNYVLKTSDFKNSYSEILVEVFNIKDLYNIIHFVREHGYKMIFCYHKKESEEKKEHIHVYIKSDRHHRFNLCRLLSNTLVEYNFMKCKTTNLDFINYVMHCDYDFKEKYTFKEVHFINVSASSKKEYYKSVSGWTPEIEDDKEIYNPAQFEKALFRGDFKKWEDIVKYCSRNEDLRRYFVFHCGQIRTAFFTSFDGCSVKSQNDVYEYIYTK